MIDRKHDEFKRKLEDDNAIVIISDDQDWVIDEVFKHNEEKLSKNNALLRHLIVSLTELSEVYLLELEGKTNDELIEIIGQYDQFVTNLLKTVTVNYGEQK